jgi:prepilin-type N-terminal cleavage/methylation domain-containing protein
MTRDRLRGVDAAESGFTLVEISITLLLLSLVLVMILQSMVSVQNAVDRETGRNTRNDRLHLAVYAIERQVRSGNVIGDPATLNDPSHGIYPGMAVRVYTQADASASGLSRCVEYRINGSQLQSREWSPNWAVDGIYTGWRILADGIRNRDVTPNVTAFVLPSTLSYHQRLLEVHLVSDGLGASGGGHERNVQRIDTSVTGRNVGFGYPTNTCASGPPYP